MRWIKLVILFILPLASVGQGNLMFEKANELYHNKNYDSAQALYTKLLNNGFCSADLYYNAGNAYFRTNKVGLSIWAYKKSMAIENDRDVIDNYLIAKKRITNPLIQREPIFFIKWWRAAYGLFTVNVWSIIGLVAFIFWLGILFFERLQSRGFPLWFKRSLLSISLLAISLMFVRYYNDLHHYQAVVIAQCNFSNNPLSKVTEKISEGIEVRILEHLQDKTGGMAKVQLPDAREGWVMLRDIKKI